jgi:cysteine desulfurase
MPYLDHAATTPLDEKVLEAMRPYLTTDFGNPSSVHRMGREARAAVERSRDTVAGTLSCDPKEIVFTSGGTESVQAIFWGAAMAAPPGFRHLVVSSVEHSCVLESAELLRRHGFTVTQVGVDSEGRVDPRQVDKAIRPGETFLVSVMAANNEVGTLQPIGEIGAIARSHRALFHTDAVQAYGKVPLDPEKQNIDFLSVSAHKIYGPKGAGFHFQRKGVELVPLIKGGGQERGRRGGTENVAGIVGLAEAARLIFSDPVEQERLRVLARLFQDRFLRAFPSGIVNGPRDPGERVPGLVNVTLPGLEGETLVHSLDARGFALSSGPACAAGSAPPSHVLLVMGRSPQEAKQGLRFSFGRHNRGEELEELLNVLPAVVAGLEQLGSFLDGEASSKEPGKAG